MKWPGNIADAKRIQECLREKVVIAPYPGEPAIVAGVDAAFSGTHVYAVACLYSCPELRCLEQVIAVRKLRFPYVPGYLSFREGPAIMEALGKLKLRPDVILVDGQGIAHPRGIGIASHLGVLLHLPTIGCAKTRLIGDHREPGRKRGAWSELRYEGKIVGAVLRTRDDVRPLFISAGHRMDLESAIRIVPCCLGRYRIPEPLRCADVLSKGMRRLAEDPAGSGRRTVAGTNPRKKERS
jgi:deoxyribonuclease V